MFDLIDLKYSGNIFLGRIVMKFLVCVDGSEQSYKAIDKAATIAAGLDDCEITAIYVYHIDSLVGVGEAYFTEEMIRRVHEQSKEEGENILADAQKIFEKRNLKVDTLLKEGHVATTIIELAEEGKYDVVVLGSRGLGGFKKLLLGSVSNAIAQEVKASVFIVK